MIVNCVDWITRVLYAIRLYYVGLYSIYIYTCLTHVSLKYRIHQITPSELIFGMRRI